MNFKSIILTLLMIMAATIGFAATPDSEIREGMSLEKVKSISKAHHVKEEDVFLDMMYVKNIEHSYYLLDSENSSSIVLDVASNAR